MDCRNICGKRSGHWAFLVSGFSQKKEWEHTLVWLDVIEHIFWPCQKSSFNHILGNFAINFRLSRRTTAPTAFQPLHSSSMLVKRKIGIWSTIVTQYLHYRHCNETIISSLQPFLEYVNLKKNGKWYNAHGCVSEYLTLVILVNAATETKLDWLQLWRQSPDYLVLINSKLHVSPHSRNKPDVSTCDRMQACGIWITHTA